MKKNYKLTLAAALLLAGLAAPAFADSFSLTVGVPPPAPIVEAVPVAPGPQADYEWLPGYWTWANERHVWAPGHWARRPHPGAHWEHAQWMHDKDGYHLQHGHWR